MAPKPSTSSTGGASKVSVVRPIVQRDYSRTRPKRVSPFSEIGTSGLKQYSGWVLDEFLSELEGREAAWRYREFLDNDPVAGGFLFMIEMLAQRVTYSVEGGEPRWRKHVEQCMHDMSHGWDDFVCEALTHLPYGYAFHEEVFKYRRGEQPGQDDIEAERAENRVPLTEEPQHQASSIYTDGLVGWRKLPLRAQETTLHWDFDGYSSLRGLVQLDWHGGHHNIPITKGVLIRNRRVRNNPEGYSILRRAWTSFFRMRGLQDIEAIGAARDLAGIPSAKPPPGVDLFADENKGLYNEIVELVTTVHRDEDEGLVWPTADWDFELISSSGSRQFDIDKIIRRYEQRIAASVAADFMLLGQDGLGSYAMVDVKSELFGMAVDGMIGQILKPMNRYAIPRLLRLNGVKTTDPPKIVATTAGRIDLEKVGLFLSNLGAAGLQVPNDPKFMKQLFEAAGLGSDFEFPAAPKPEPAEPAKKPEPKKPEPSKLSKAVEGEVLEVGPALAARAKVLSGSLDREITAALQEMASRAAQVYFREMRKDERPSKREIRGLAHRIVRQLNIAQWVRERLTPLLARHGSRVAKDVGTTLTKETGMAMRVPEEDARQIVGSRRLTARDIEPQVRKAIILAIEQGLAAGDNPARTAERIRKSVPAGRFTKAGPGYRSELISKEETVHAMRASTLAAYKANPSVSGLKLRDGIYGPPRSDAFCRDRDGEVVSIDDPPGPAHVGCTLSYDAVVQTPEADLVAA